MKDFAEYERSLDCLVMVGEPVEARIEEAFLAGQWSVRPDAAPLEVNTGALPWAPLWSRLASAFMDGQEAELRRARIGGSSGQSHLPH